MELPSVLDVGYLYLEKLLFHETMKFVEAFRLVDMRSKWCLIINPPIRISSKIADK